MKEKKHLKIYLLGSTIFGIVSIDKLHNCNERIFFSNNGFKIITFSVAIIAIAKAKNASSKI